ncbi:MAG: hypothetical protein ACR2NZ_17410 [Rubripirellula sp.]
MDRAFMLRWITTMCGTALLTASVASTATAQKPNLDVTSPAASSPAASSPQLVPPSTDPSDPPRLDPPVPPGREVEVPQPGDTIPKQKTEDIDVPEIRPSQLEPTDSFEPRSNPGVDVYPNEPGQARDSPRTRVQDALRGYDESTMIDEVDSEESRADIIPQALSDEERSKLGIKQGRFRLPTLAAPTTTQPTGDNNRTPPSFSDNQELLTEPLPESGTDRAPDWHWSVCSWSAANTFSNPRYFEDRMLERHGHERWGHLQPVASGARFFTTFPMMPYLWTVKNPCECEYTLGYMRSGSCVPVMMQRPPYEKRALIVEAATVAGLIIGFP